jgi:hypothetical protein
MVQATAFWVAWKEFRRAASLVTVGMVPLVVSGILVPLSALGHLISRRATVMNQLTRSFAGSGDKGSPR